VKLNVPPCLGSWASARLDTPAQSTAASVILLNIMISPLLAPFFRFRRVFLYS
jgi:hypothetical protein